MKKHLGIIVTLILITCIGVSYAWFSGVITGEGRGFAVNAKELKNII